MTTTQPSVLTEISDSGIATIILNRPELHNAFDDATIALLTQKFIDLDSADKVKIIVLKATGKSFCAGADLNWMKKMATYDREQNYQDSVRLAQLMHTIFHCNKPTVAICQGSAFGGGVGLLACCDIVLSADNAKFCLSEVKLGLIPAVISPFVVRALGERQAKRYFISAEIFNAEEALAMGLVHRTFDSNELEQNAGKYCEKLLANGPVAMSQAKRLVSEVCNQPISEEVLQHTARRIADIRSSKEGKEGINAFLERRSAHWQ